MIVNCLNIKNISLNEFHYYINFVSVKRRNKALRFHLMKDTYKCVFSEILLLYCLHKTFNKKIEMNLKYGMHGKPSMENLKNFHFNISHSGNWVVVAYGTNEVGVDIEKIRSEKSIIPNRVLNEKEKKYIYSKKEKQISRFIKIWSAKESYVKYLGTELSTALKSFSVCITKNNKLFINNNKKVFINSMLFDKNYYLTTCCTEKNVKIKKITLENIYNKLTLHKTF